MATRRVRVTLDHRRKPNMAQIEPASINLTQLTVSELASALKRTLEDRFGYVRVRGEVSGFRGPHTSGHVYFALKVDAARLEAVIWRTTFARMKVKPQEGLEIIASGRISTFPGKSSYQIVVESVEAAGIGALMTLLENRRKQLAAEGLFDLARKRALPYMPRTIGVITSPSGAVIHDILHRVGERFPTRVLVWPVRVQGDGAAAEIAAAIRGMNNLPSDSQFQRPDVLIVARGGGSLEDLWCFNEEDVVRAAAESSIPLVSAVGHETDWTLIDYAADMRAPTPTAAAEFCLPVRAELTMRIAQLGVRRQGAASRLGQQSAARLRAAIRGASTIRSLWAGQGQRLDAAFEAVRNLVEAGIRTRAIGGLKCAGVLARHAPFSRMGALRARLQTAGGRAWSAQRARVTEMSRTFRQSSRQMGERLRSIHQSKREKYGTFEILLRFRRTSAKRLPADLKVDLIRRSDDLRRARDETLRRKRADAAELARLFSAFNFKSVVARGFAVVFDKKGVLISTASTARAARVLKIHFADGEVAATTEGAKRPTKGKVDAKQSELF
jgi:exodeoxyribonuclease VII large subunit